MASNLEAMASTLEHVDKQLPILQKTTSSQRWGAVEAYHSPLQNSINELLGCRTWGQICY